MVKINLRLISFVFLIFLMMLDIQAIVYPAQAVVFLTPPYSPRLTNYTSAASNKMSVQLMLKESIGGVPVNVKIRVIIECSGRRIATRGNYSPSKPIILEPGIPYLIEGPELAPYMNPDNLEFEGIDVNQFLNDKKLPEGNYTFRIEIIEYYRGVVISDPYVGSKTIMIVENDPPVWLLPASNSPITIDATEPQFIIFSWQPKQLSSFIAQYEFLMVEMYDVNADPNAAFQSLTKLFKTTTSSTSLVYDISSPQLIGGRTYICQVTASDPENLGLFKNDGKSNLFVFKWGQTCKTPTLVTSSPMDLLTSEKISWVPSIGNTSFKVQYREVTDSTISDYYTDDVSYDNISQNVEHKINYLKAGHTYEYEVKAVCGNSSSEFSAPLTFSTAPKQQTSITNTCGNSYTNPDITNKTDIDHLSVSDNINVGGFSATLTEVSGNASGYSGNCIVSTTTMGIRIKAHFTAIKVNTEKQVYEGNIICDYNPGNLINLDQVKNDATTIATLAEQSQKELKDMVTGIKSYLASDPSMSDVILDFDTTKIIPEDIRSSLENIYQGIKDEDRANQLVKQGFNAKGDSLLEVARNEIDNGKQVIKEKADIILLKVLDNLTPGTSGTLITYVQNNYQKLLNNFEVVWGLTSTTNRTQIIEELLSKSDFAASKGWSNIGQLKDGSPEIGNFFKNNEIFSNLKSTNATDLNSIKLNIGTFKNVIDKLAEIKTGGIFTTSSGEQLSVSDARLDIVVPKRYNVALLNEVKDYGTSKNVAVGFIFK